MGAGWIIISALLFASLASSLSKLLPFGPAERPCDYGVFIRKHGELWEMSSYEGEPSSGAGIGFSENSLFPLAINNPIN